MKIGIPRSLLYYKNEKLWTTFLDELGVDYVISPDTNKEIIDNGTKFAVDEECLPVKIFLGHFYYLLDKCDYIFVPRIEYTTMGEMCMNFKAQFDLVANTFRDYNPKILYYNISWKKVKKEYQAFKKMGKFLGKKRSVIKSAYQKAKQTQLAYEVFRTESQEQLLNLSTKHKVLVVAHAYNVGDKYIGSGVLTTLKNLGCDPIIAEYADAKKCINLSKKVSQTLPWAYSKQLVGAIEYYSGRIDGMIILTTFPCNPDSMVNEMIVRKFKDIPTLMLTIDAQDGSAGIETRLESFVDILNFKKEQSV